MSDMAKTSIAIALADVVPPSEIRELASAAADLSLISAVTDDASARKAKSAVKAVKDVVKSIADKRLDLTRKADAWKKAIIDQERSLTNAANAEISRVNALLSAYVTAKAEAEAAARAAEEAARLEEQRKAEEVAAAEAALTGKTIVVPEVVAEPTEHCQKTPLVRGVTSRTVWTFDIVDPDAVPRAYCSPDEKAIRAYMDAAKKSGASIESLSIPGVTFRKEIRV